MVELEVLPGVDRLALGETSVGSRLTSVDVHARGCALIVRLCAVACRPVLVAQSTYNRLDCMYSNLENVGRCGNEELPDWVDCELRRVDHTSDEVGIIGKVLHPPPFFRGRRYVLTWPSARDRHSTAATPYFPMKIFLLGSAGVVSLGDWILGAGTCHASIPNRTPKVHTCLKFDSNG